MKKSKPITVFISYKHQDDSRNAWVDKFYRDLRAVNIDAKLDQYEVAPGESFSDYMTREIRNCDYFLFVVTPKSVKAVESGKGALAFEMQIANARRLSVKKNLVIIPIFREGVETSSYLSDYRYLDFRDDSEYDSKLDELIKWLKGNIQPPKLPSESQKGIYVVVEGISGIGKSSVANLLTREINQQGYKSIAVHEPEKFVSVFLRNPSLLGQVGEGENAVDAQDLRSLFIADCYNLATKRIKPELANGSILVSDRSYISSLVYMCTTEDDTTEYLSQFSFMPYPDAIILLDASPRVTFLRRLTRQQSFLEQGYNFEYAELEERIRHRYISICKKYFTSALHIINADQELTLVSKQAYQALVPILKRKSKENLLTIKQ